MRKKLCMVLGGIAAGVAFTVACKKLYDYYHEDTDDEWDEFFDDKNGVHLDDSDPFKVKQ